MLPALLELRAHAGMCACGVCCVCVCRWLKPILP